MKRLIVTIAAGDSIDYGDITIPRFFKYAKKHNADLWVITTPIFGEVINATTGQGGNPSWWKLPLIEWFAEQDNYHQLCYIDIDVLVMEKSPCIFDFHRQGFSMCPDMNSAREWPLWQEWRAEHYPGAEVQETLEKYFNAGVWVTDRPSAIHLTKIMDHYPEIHSRWMEQDYVNFITRAAGFLHELPEEFNHPVPHLSRSLNHGCFLHLCGLAQDQKREWLIRMELAELNGDDFV